jgi:hypothetical protein
MKFFSFWNELSAGSKLGLAFVAATLVLLLLVTVF